MPKAPMAGEQRSRRLVDDYSDDDDDSDYPDYAFYELCQPFQRKFALVLAVVDMLPDCYYQR